MTVNGGTYGNTSGTEVREARPMIEPLMHFSLADEIAALRAEDGYRTRDRASRTLAKETDFRVLLSCLRAGARLDEQQGDARISVHVLDGTALLGVNGDETLLEAHEMAVVDAAEPWLLEARSECAVLLTLAWPREKAGV